MHQRPLGHLLRQIGKIAAEDGTQDLSDKQLLGRFRSSGEEASFALILQRHGPMVLGISLPAGLLGTSLAETGLRAPTAVA